MIDPRAGELLEIRGTPVGDPRWSEVEEELGTKVPSEYKRIVERFGDYYWNRCFYVLNPFSPKQYLNLFSGGRMILEAEEIMRQESPELYVLPLYPEQGGLLPWGVSDFDDTFFWLTKGKADEWPTVVKGRSGNIEIHFGACDLFLHLVATGRIQSGILPRVGNASTRQPSQGRMPR